MKLTPTQKRILEDARKGHLLSYTGNSKNKLSINGKNTTLKTVKPLIDNGMLVEPIFSLGSSSFDYSHFEYEKEMKNKAINDILSILNTDDEIKPYSRDEVLAEINRNGELAKGWDYHISYANYDKNRVYKVCTDGCFNGKGWEKTGLQGIGTIYKTKKDAIKAMKKEIVIKALISLLKIDKDILHS